jgi:hypothetical protein
MLTGTVLTLLYLTDKRVRQQLFDLVQKSHGWMVVAMAQHGPEMREVEDREPFATLERDHGGWLHTVVVLDEGKPEGMWRDPVGDLAEHLYPDDRAQASLATRGYFVLRDGAPADVVTKHASLAEDARAISEVLGKAPRAQGRPRPSSPGTSSRPHASPPRESGEQDPYLVLGISRDTPHGEARRAFRALVAQYHPDKVAHMAPEFRTLAETRTRELTQAWERIQREREQG